MGSRTAVSMASFVCFRFYFHFAADCCQWSRSRWLAGTFRSRSFFVVRGPISSLGKVAALVNCLG